MYNLIIFGPPGSGKGTQAQMIAQKFGLEHISTGELLRIEMEKDSIIGLKIAELINSGNLVPDKIVLSIIENKLKKLGPLKKGFIYDGFPRNYKQAVSFDSILRSYNLDISQIIYLRISTREIVSRILKRASKSGRIDDLNTSIIEHRIKEYRNKTEQLINYYRNRSIYSEIYGIGDIEEIFTKICGIIDTTEYVKSKFY